MGKFIAKYLVFFRLKKLNGNISRGNFVKHSVKRRFRQAYQGQALIPMVLFILMGVMLLGVVVEAGNLFIARRQLQNDADAAATWGAMQLDIGGLRVSDGDKVHVISPGNTQESADVAGLNISEFMTRAGYHGNEWDWQWGRCTMQIDIKHKVPTVFVSIVGVREVSVGVSAKARLNNTDQKITCG
ncbi:MAG TPA: Tad domain-containing protein [Chloroflexia bacterium]|nr:Tad domain-containing protein [Chloroflexia bacterium]